MGQTALAPVCALWCLQHSQRGMLCDTKVGEGSVEASRKIQLSTIDVSPELRSPAVPVTGVLQEPLKVFLEDTGGARGGWGVWGGNLGSAVRRKG